MEALITFWQTGVIPGLAWEYIAMTSFGGDTGAQQWKQ